MAYILVIEDDETIGSALEWSLRSAGHAVRWSRSGWGALDAVAEKPPELVVLDLGLPDIDGLRLCRQLRELLPTAVIVILTARTDQIDIVDGLESGADDYLLKPFRLVEVAARLRAHLRRVEMSSTRSATGDDVVYGSLRVHWPSRRAFVGPVELELRRREFQLLSRLLQSAGAAVSREDLMRDVWEDEHVSSSKTLDVHIAALRQRITAAARSAGDEATGQEPQIVTLRGHGYRLDLSG